MFLNGCFHLEDDEEGKEDQHKEQQATGVQRKEVILVGEIRLTKGKNKSMWFRQKKVLKISSAHITSRIPHNH